MAAAAFALPPFSAEQSSLLRAVRNGANVVMDAVPGSGKTTSALYIAMAFPEKQIMIVTYNRDLKHDTCAKIKALALDNCIATNYHSLCCKYYSPNTWKDEHIVENVLNKDAVLHGMVRLPDILIVDEAQDMTPTLFRLIRKFIVDTSNPQIIVFGDKNQNIYTFAKADSRFIELAPSIYEPNKRSWAKVPLSVTHRLTRPMAAFMNRCVLDTERMVSLRDGPPVQYWNVNIYKVADRIFEFIKQGGFAPEDVLILAPSVGVQANERSPIAQLVNILAFNNWPVEVQGDDVKGGEKCTQKKTIVTSYHRSKGLGRACVIVYSADASYFEFYNKHCDPLMCSNPQYVAFTRSYNTLLLLRHFENRPLAFLMGKEEAMAECTVVYEDEDASKLRKQKEKGREKAATPYAMTRLLRHLPDDVLQKAYDYLALEEINPIPDAPRLHLPSETSQGSLTERVSDLTGTALPIMLASAIGAQRADITAMRWRNPRLCTLMRRECGSDPGPLTIKEALMIALLKDANSTGMRHRLRQIRRFDWVTDEVAAACIGRMQAMLKPILDFNSQKVVFEEDVQGTFASGRGMRGIVDILDVARKVPIEVKCCTALSTDHFIQVAGYMHMLGSTVGYVINPVTHALVRVEASLDSLKSMMDYLEHYKLEGAAEKERLTDAEFVVTCRLKEETHIMM
jgi:hypothetical protein